MWLWIKGLYAAYRIWFLIVPLAGLVAGVWLYVRSAEHAKEKLAVVEYQLGQAQVAAKENSRAAGDCLALNAANAEAAKRQQERLHETELRLARAEARSDTDVETIRREENDLRATGRECPAIDDAFRDWVRVNP